MDQHRNILIKTLDLKGHQTLIDADSPYIKTVNHQRKDIQTQEMSNLHMQMNFVKMKAAKQLHSLLMMAQVQMIAYKETLEIAG